MEVQASNIRTEGRTLEHASQKLEVGRAVGYGMMGAWVELCSSLIPILCTQYPTLKT